MTTKIDGVLAAIERFCRTIGILCLILMLTVVATEVVLRSFFSMSLGFADEVSGYFLVALCFFSLSVTYAHGGFHRVEFLVQALPPRGSAVLTLLANLIALLFALVLVWQFSRSELQAIRLHTAAPTMLGTPQWLPMAAMLGGTILFFLTLVRACIASAAEVLHPGARDALPIGQERGA